MKILVVGSLNVDWLIRLENMPVVGETITAKDVKKQPGGKGANQAYAAAKLGGDVTILGSIGEDKDGALLLESLNAVGVNTTYLNACDTHTGIALVTVNDEGDNSIVVVPGANAKTDTAYIDKFRSVIEASDIILLQLEIPLESVLHVAKLGHNLGKFVILDPAPAVADLPDELFGYIDLIKPNEIELRQLLRTKGDDLPPEAAVQHLHDKGVPHVLLTMGKEGSILYSNDGYRHFSPAIPVKAVDTTAAGDSFVAAFAIGIAEGKSFAEAQDWATSVAAIVVTRSGAQYSIPKRSEI